MAKINGATLIARSLKQQGIDHLFGVVGFPVGPIAEAAQKEGMKYRELVPRPPRNCRAHCACSPPCVVTARCAVIGRVKLYL